MYGPEGDSEATEELYDLAYDPREKFNLAAAFSHTHKDVARPSEGGVPFHHVSSRLNTNLEKAKHPETLPEKYGGTKFKNSFLFCHIFVLECKMKDGKAFIICQKHFFETFFCIFCLSTKLYIKLNFSRKMTNSPFREGEKRCQQIRLLF